MSVGSICCFTGTWAVATVFDASAVFEYPVPPNPGFVAVVAVKVDMPAVVVAEVVCACPNKLGAVVVVDVVRVFVDGVNENEAVEVVDLAWPNENESAAFEVFVPNANDIL